MKHKAPLDFLSIFVKLALFTEFKRNQRNQILIKRVMVFAMTT